jgi:predicted GNAT family acetyltransferase
MADAAAQVKDRPERNRYELVVDDETAFLTYRRKPDHTLLAHTEVPVSLRGRGLGQKLAKHALDEARHTGSHVIVKCPFVTAWLKSHPEYDDIVIARVTQDGDVSRQPPNDPR